MKTKILNIAALLLVIQYFIGCAKEAKPCESYRLPVIKVTMPTADKNYLSLSLDSIDESTELCLWHGPNGFTAQGSSAVVEQPSAFYNGVYYVDVILRNGCILNVQTDSIVLQGNASPCGLNGNRAIIEGVKNREITSISGYDNGISREVMLNTSWPGESVYIDFDTNPNAPGKYNITDMSRIRVEFGEANGQYRYPCKQGTLYVTRNTAGKLCYNMCDGYFDYRSNMKKGSFSYNP